MNPIYCRACHAEITPGVDTCPSCAAPQSREAAEAAAAKSAAEQRAKEWRGADLSGLRDGERARYLKTTGHGICPGCKSANVKPIKLREGGIPGALGVSVALAALGFFFVGPFCFWVFGGPLAAFALGVVGPGLILIFGALASGKSFPASRCNYCGNRWRI